MSGYKKYITVFMAVFFVVLVVSAVTGTVNATQRDSQSLEIELTAQEQAYIKENKTITIAMDQSWIPYCFYDSKEETVKGILPNILNEIAANLDMDVEYVAKDTYADAIFAAASGETMLVSGIADDQKAAQNNNILRTSPYIIINYSMVTKNIIPDLYAEGASYKAAVCTGSYATTLMKEKMPSYQFVEYHNNDECMEAVMSGDTDIALVATHSAEYYSTMHEYSSLTVTMINDFTWGLCFGVNKDVDPVFIEILNKGIYSLHSNISEQAVYNGLLEATETNHSLRDFIYDEPIAAISVSVLIAALLILVTFLAILHRGKQAEIIKEQEQLKKVENALTEAHNANASKNEFFSRMSHDLRTPMNGILGMTQLSIGETDVHVLMENLDKIKNSGEYLLGLINDSLDFQKIDSGKMTIEPEIVYTKDILGNIVDMVDQTAKNKGVELKVINENANLDCYIKVDPMRIKQILVNLLSNAIKFTPKGGIVELSFSCIEREGMISHDIIRVKDTGIGMSREFLENGIFQPFSQERNEVTAQYAGSGLGLSIAKKLVEMMNGRIEVESELGVGTTFSIYFDFERIDAEEARQVLNNRARTMAVSLETLKQKQILLVEDHPLNAEIARKLLERVGCVVTWAENGRIGVERFQSSEAYYFDEILMDIRMPEMDGIEAAKAIRLLERADAKTIPIIAMTANAYDNDIKLSFESGMNGHLSKPVEPKVMYETMVKLMA